MLTANHKKPEWFFYPGWIILTFLGVPIALFLELGILRVIVSFIGDIIYVNGVRHITEDYLSTFTFIPIIGLLTGLLQYGLLRIYLPRMGWWVLATTLGWLMGLLMILTSGWLSQTNPYFNLDLAFILIGLSIGTFQWLLLRRRLPRAIWWIPANVLAWGLMTLITTGNSIGQLGLMTLGLIPGLVTAPALAMLMNSVPPKES